MEENAMARVLVVDDVEENTYLLDSLLRGHGYEVDRASNGSQALELAKKSPPDMVISDILMPVMDGFALCREWHKDEQLRGVPFIFYTATYTDPKDEAFALGVGADRFIVKPTDPTVFMAIIEEALANHAGASKARPTAEVQAEEIFLKQYNEALVRKLEDKLDELKLVNIALEHTCGKLDRIFLQTVNALASAMTQRDAYTARHQRRCAELAAALAEKMGSSKDDIEGMRVAALLHDIGKLAVPAEVLVKPETLSDIEWTLIRNHVNVGYDIIRQIEFPWPVADVVRQHHERLDGSGYPRGISGGEILRGSRILAVVDVVEAMTSHRPYRPARPLEQALDEIMRNRSKLFDPDVAAACNELADAGAFPW
jgi:putative two-component system response regulator